MFEFSLAAICTVILEMFMFGLIIGHTMSEREKPSEPKPKKWDDLMMKQWRKGFHAGEKSMANRMRSKLKDEELIELYYSENGKKL